MQDFITTYDSMTAPSLQGTSLKGHLGYGITYNMLVEYLGEPTFLPEDSGDGKVNFKWVIEYNDDLFTIYDWKVDPEYSKINTGMMDQADEWFGGSRWHVGSKTYAGDFIDFIEKEIKEKNLVEKLSL